MVYYTIAFSACKGGFPRFLFHFLALSVLKKLHQADSMESGQAEWPHRRQHRPPIKADQAIRPLHQQHRSSGGQQQIPGRKDQRRRQEQYPALTIFTTTIVP